MENQAQANYELERSAKHEVRPKFHGLTLGLEGEFIVGDRVDVAKVKDRDLAVEMVCRFNAHDALVGALQALCNAVDSCVDLTPEVMRQALAAIALTKE